MRKPYNSFNPYFLVPFAIWFIGGGIVLLNNEKGVVSKLVNTHHTDFLDVFMYRATMMGEGMVITLILLILLGMSTLRNWWYFAAALFTNILPSILTQIIKRTVNAPRPLKYFGDAQWIHTLPEWPRYMDHSFPSGHTCGAFCLFTFLSFLLAPKYRWVGIIFFLLALLVAYTRIYLVMHFFEDVYIGSIIGTLSTVFIMWFMNRLPRKATQA